MGSALPCRLFLVADVARSRGPAVVALFVAIDARQGAVQPGQVAANAHVVEARWGEGPLGVARAAPRRERVCVNVILPMAVDAEISRAGQTAIVHVASLAALLVVSALEVKVTNVVKSDDVRETLSRMARRAVGAELSLVNARLGMTRAAAIAILRSRLERHAGVTIRAGDREVLAG